MKKFLTISILVGIIMVLSTPIVFADLEVGDESLKIESPQCCKLKHEIVGWGADYDAGDWVGAISYDANGDGSIDEDDWEIICPGSPLGYTSDPNWAGFCMLDGIASIGDIVKYAAMIAVGVALLIAAVMFVASAGNPERVGVARKIFYYSFIGIMIATLAHFLPGVVRFFLGI
jgi:hypothetical protein